MLEVTDTSRPVQLRLVTDTDNSWAEFPMRVTSPDGTPVVDAFLPISYYWGYSEGERWTEGSQADKITFMPSVPGTYRIALGQPEGEAAEQRRVSLVRLEGREGVMTIRWPIMALILFIVLFAFSLTRKMRFNMKRAAGTDWHDED